MRIAGISWRVSGFLGVSLLAVAGLAQEVRYVEENGVTYQETRRVVPRAITETKIVPREQVVYRDKYTTDLQPSERRYMLPITEYRWEPQWVNRWNPFSAPYVTYRWMPVTRWEPRSETVKIPVTRREVVPEKITVNVPVTSQRFVEDVHSSRVAISAASQGVTSPSSDPFDRGGESGVARRETIGGVRRLDSDPPREGDWRPAEAVRR